MVVIMILMMTILMKIMVMMMMMMTENEVHRGSKPIDEENFVVLGFNPAICIRCCCVLRKGEAFKVVAEYEYNLNIIELQRFSGSICMERPR